MIDYIFTFLNYVQLLVENNFLMALSIYFIFCLIFFFLSLPGGLIICVSSGFFFGFYIGFFINITSLTFGSLLFTLVSKYFLKNYFNSYLEKYLYRLNNIVKKSSYDYLILIRFIFGIPLVVQNLFISTLEISNYKFVISSVIGFSPYLLIFSYVGFKISNLIEIKNLSLTKIFSFELLLIIVILICYILFRISKKYKD